MNSERIQRALKFRRKTRTPVSQAVEYAHSTADKYGSGRVFQSHSKSLEYGRIVVEISPERVDEVRRYLEEELGCYDYEIARTQTRVGIRYITAQDCFHWGEPDTVDVAEIPKGDDDVC